MAALRMAGSWLQGNGWAETLVQADIASPGTANSFLKAAHVTRTRRGHQITAATLNILQHKAYGTYTEDTQSDGHEPLEFGVWCQQRAECCPQFQYWATTLNLELSIFMFVRSLRESNFSLYMDALAELCQWFFALDHTHYSRWVPVHLKDMTELSDKHPDLADKITDSPHVTSTILDGPAVVEVLKPGGSRIFQEYSTAVFIPYIESQLEYRSRLDLVWDCYLKSGRLKATVRCNRGKGILRRVTASGPLPSNWQNFLCNSDNKEELFSFLSEQVMQLVVKESKQLVVTGKKQVLTVPPRKDTANLAPCKHEEADTRMMVHAADALECGHRVSRNNGLRHGICLCKKAAWATWNAFPEVTTAFLSLVSTLSELPDGVLSTLERFIVLLYDRTSTCCDVNVLRKKLFSRKSRSLEHLPPTRAALEQHIKRAAYQAGHIWGQAAIAFVSLPSPCDWGWMKSGDELEPFWTTLSEVSKSCHELISCGCKKHCGGKCRCKIAALKCTGLCACEGGC
ncbi:hypothetical protein Hamer_G002412 [Homarus americanus]|uniref:Tesmin/TSO1-like CXC domain-containing protein n=1 Tax=Homarus americanus TaxID=6706 RepID=A0A8J5MYB9_HOMAM|nr:hypothetical protein Hamer_G002412 [Homarus americanus]